MILIIGGGVIGLSIAWKLIQIGKKVLILDKATHQIIYAGYSKDIKDTYSMQQGKIISLQLQMIISRVLPLLLHPPP